MILDIFLFKYAEEMPGDDPRRRIKIHGRKTDMYYIDRNMSIAYLENQIAMTSFAKEREMKLKFTFRKYNSVFIFKIFMCVYSTFILALSYVQECIYAGLHNFLQISVSGKFYLLG